MRYDQGKQAYPKVLGMKFFFAEKLDQGINSRH